MITIIVCITFLGFMFAYYTSKRAQIPRTPLANWSRKNGSKSNTMGVVLMILGLLGSIYQLGTTSGIFSFLVILMTVASLTVMVYPLHFIPKKVLVPIAFLFLLIEIYFQ